MDEHSLVTAYHLIFDEKDRQVAGSPQAYAAYEALQALERLMVGVGVEVPRRFDKKVG